MSLPKKLITLSSVLVACINRVSDRLYLIAPKHQDTNKSNYLEKSGKASNPFKDLNSYELQHLASHLVSANMISDLHRIFSLETSDNRNAWYSAKLAVGDTQGFLEDLELAWTQANRMPEEKLEESILLNLRYALTQASVNSISVNLPLKIVVACIEKNFWSIDQALAYIQQQDPKQQVNTIVDLLESLNFEVLPDNLDTCRKQLLSIAIGACSLIQDPEVRTHSLLKIFQFDKDEIFPIVLGSAKKIDSFVERQKAFCKLADYKPKEVISIAIRDIQNEYRYVSWDSYTFEYNVIKKTQLYSNLIPHAPDIVIPIALKDARNIVDNESSLSKFLVEIAPYCEKPFLQDALTIARSVKQPEYCAPVIAALSSHDPDKLISEAFEKADEIVIEESDRKYGNYNLNLIPFLLSIIPNLTNDFFPKALRIAKKIQYINKDDYVGKHYITNSSIRYGASGTVTLLRFLPNHIDITKELFSAIFQETNPPESSEEVALTFAIANHVTASTFPYMLFRLQSLSYKDIEYIDSKIIRTMFSELAPKITRRYLSDILQLLEKRFYRYKSDCFLILASVATKDFFPQILDAISDLFYTEKSEVLIALAPKIPKKFLPKAMELTQEIEEPKYRVPVLAALLPLSPKKIFSKVLKDAHLIEEIDERSLVFIKLLKHDYNKTFPELLNIIYNYRNEDIQSKVLIQMSSTVSKTHTIKFLEILQRIEDKSVRSDVFNALSSDVVDDFLPLLADHIQRIKDFKSYVVVLTKLALLIDDEASIRDALDAAQLSKNDQLIASVIGSLSSILSDELLLHSVELTRTIKNSDYSAHAFISLAQHHPEIFREALGVVEKISNFEDCIRSFSLLVDINPLETLPKALQLIQKKGCDTEKVKAFKVLAPKINKDFIPEALKVIDSIKSGYYYTDCYFRAQALVELAPYVSKENLWEVLEMVQQFETMLSELREGLEFELDPNNRFKEILILARCCIDILIPLVPYNLDLIFPKALRIARSIEQPQDRIAALSKLSLYEPKLVLREALEIFNENGRPVIKGKYKEDLSVGYTFEDSSKVEAFRDLAPHISPEFLLDAFKVAHNIQHIKNGGIIFSTEPRDRALLSLAPQISKEFLPDAIDIANEIVSPTYRADFLSQLVSHDPDKILPIALQTLLYARRVQADKHESYHVELFLRIEPYLTNVFLEDALEIVDDLHPNVKVWCLLALSRLEDTKLVPQIIQMSREIEDIEKRLKAITIVTKAYPKHLSISKIAQELTDILYSASKKSKREVFLENIELIANLIKRLSDQETDLLVANHIKQIYSWWP